MARRELRGVAGASATRTEAPRCRTAADRSGGNARSSPGCAPTPTARPPARTARRALRGRRRRPHPAASTHMIRQGRKEFPREEQVAPSARRGDGLQQQHRRRRGAAAEEAVAALLQPVVAPAGHRARDVSGARGVVTRDDLHRVGEPQHTTAPVARRAQEWVPPDATSTAPDRPTTAAGRVTVAVSIVPLPRRPLVLLPQHATAPVARSAQVTVPTAISTTPRASADATKPRPAREVVFSQRDASRARTGREAVLNVPRAARTPPGAADRPRKLRFPSWTWFRTRSRTRRRA